MERLELVVVQFDECRRLIEKGGPAYLRLALILIDNAVEVIMSHRIKNALTFNYLHGALLEAYDQHGPDGPDPERVAEARQKFMPKSKLRDIERKFGKKVDFLLGRSMIPASLGAGLHKLHRGLFSVAPEMECYNG